MPSFAPTASLRGPNHPDAVRAVFDRSLALWDDGALAVADEDSTPGCLVNGPLNGQHPGRQCEGGGLDRRVSELTVLVLVFPRNRTRTGAIGIGLRSRPPGWSPAAPAEPSATDVTRF